MLFPALGIDIAKRKFDVALLVGGKLKHKVCPNNHEGFVALSAWLARQGVDKVHACMEATGAYGEALAAYLHDNGHVVSIVNPARIKGFAQSELSRTKTDKADAALIGRFCQAMNPEPWAPAPPHVRELQALVRRLDALHGMLNQENNRLDGAASVVAPSIVEHIDYLKRTIEDTRRGINGHIDRHPDLKGKRDLLDTIPGIGETTTAVILAELRLENFTDARKMAAFTGLVPRQRISGSSVRGKTMLSKIGNSRIRKAFYMPAIVAKRYNPVVAAFCERLALAGKSKMAVIGAAMRKLVHIVFGVLKSGKPFDPALAQISC